MGLLDKLEQVEIKADSRLPEDDLMFCETQQQAYDESRRAFREIRRQWKRPFSRKKTCLVHQVTDRCPTSEATTGLG